MVIRKGEVNGDKSLKYPYIYVTTYLAAANFNFTGAQVKQHEIFLRAT